MNGGSQRLVEPDWLPTSLWSESDKAARLPREIVRIYRDRLEQSGLMELAAQRDDKNPPVGGLTQELTDLHFAQQFDGSMARAQLVLLDPHNELGPSSDMLVKTLSGGRLVLVDIPCGAGAISCSFLSNIAQLREEGILPRLPLHVTVVGGELSEPARSYAVQLLDELIPKLKRQAITVETALRSWDVLDRLSNTDLIREILKREKEAGRLLVAVANFSSFLQKESKFKEAQPQLDELMRYCSGGKGVTFWIEPATKAATTKGGLFSRIWSSIVKRLQGIVAHGDGQERDGAYQSESRFFRALAEDEKVRVTVALLPTRMEGRE
jgi:hypothetical protein